MITFRKIIKLFVILAVIDDIDSEYYTSVAGLEKLLVAEGHFVKSLEKHLVEVEKINKEFQSLLDEVQLEYAKVHNISLQHLEDPVNVFKSIRRLVVDFPRLQDLSQQIQEQKALPTLTAAAECIPPTEDDLRGAARGLSRLQHIYKLDTGHLAKGYLKHQKCSTEMSAYNCFVLGQSLYELGEYCQASEWLIEAWHKVNDIEHDVAELGDADHQPKDVTAMRLADWYSIKYDIYPYIPVTQILEYLAPALYQANFRELAMYTNTQLLELDPKNKHALANRPQFERSIREMRRKVMRNKPPNESKLQRLYAQVCRGERQQTAQQKRPLRCRYVTNNVAYYRLGPLKMEELNMDPLVLHYYEVIYDSEINQILKAVESTMHTSKVGHQNISRVDNILRISKNSWLKYNEHWFLDKISQRLEDITGLSMETGEQLQVANYGIGGHYGPHHDFSRDPKNTYRGKGNRILTALFYLNEVELGGGTAFPALGLMVPPIKGSLVMWYNLHKSVERDYRTWHAGCPVLKGSKWICNEWFHAVGQEFRRPCGLIADDDISKPYGNWC